MLTEGPMPDSVPQIEMALDKLQELEIYVSNRQPSGELAAASLWASKIISAAAWMSFGTDFQNFNGNVDDFLFILNALVGNGCIWTRWQLAMSAIRGVWDLNHLSPAPFTQTFHRWS